MKKGFKVILFSVLALVILGSCKFLSRADLRVDEYQYPKNPEKGRELLTEMGVAHQINMWDSIDTYTIIYKDEFYGFLGKKAHPFKEQELTFSLNYVPKKTTGQLEILSGKQKGKAWGIQSGQTYQTDADGIIVPKKNKDMKFWIPTYQYFIELPSRIQEASVVDYVGSKTISGIKTEGVIASWNTVSPQKDIDQYVIWLDAESKRIVKVEYTVRDAYAFVSGAVYFQDYKDYDGFILPSSMPVTSNLKKKGLLHKMSIENFTPNKVSLETLNPIAE